MQEVDFENLKDLGLLRLIAYVTPVDMHNEPLEDETSDEYLIDYLTVNEAIKIGPAHILKYVSASLEDCDALKYTRQQVTWRLLADNQQTPNEEKQKDSGKSYSVKDLRCLH